MTALGRAVTVVLVTLGLATLQGCDPAGEDADDAIGSDAAADAASEADAPDAGERVCTADEDLVCLVVMAPHPSLGKK